MYIIIVSLKALLKHEESGWSGKPLRMVRYIVKIFIILFVESEKNLNLLQIPFFFVVEFFFVKKGKKNSPHSFNCIFFNMFSRACPTPLVFYALVVVAIISK